MLSIAKFQNIVYYFCRKSHAGLLGWPPPCLWQSGWSLQRPALCLFNEARCKRPHSAAMPRQLQEATHRITAGREKKPNQLVYGLYLLLWNI